MANRIMLNETSYHGAGAIQEIATEAKARDYKKALEYLNNYKDYNTALAYLLMDYNYSALGILENLEASGDRDYLMAIAYSRLGDTEKAVRFLKSAIGQDSKFKYRYRLDPECAKLI